MHHAGLTSRLRLILLLPLLMLLAQQGAWLHQLGHAACSAHEQAMAQQADDRANGARCPTCQSFSQVSFAASATAVHSAFLPPAYLPGSEPRFAFVPVTQPRPRNRGPPAQA